MTARRPTATRALAAAGASLLATALLFVAAPAHAYGPPSQQDGAYVDTEYGPLGAGDKDLLVRVMYAGLWEIPASQMATEKGADARVREIAGYIAEEHVQLNEETERIAAELQVALPTEPHPDNQVFLDRMAAREGAEFDVEYVQRLREAHGEVYSLIAYARAGTQNDLIREFAATGEEFVARHMDYLESTGLVQWFKIPPPPEPAGSKSRFLSISPAGVNPVFIWIILGIAATAGTITVVRTIRPR